MGRLFPGDRKMAMSRVQFLADLSLPMFLKR